MHSEIRHDPRAQRFEATVEGGLCHVDYRLEGDVMVLPHTEVPPALRGRGIAARLVEAALAHARAHGLRIDARCAYVRSYLQRHPEAQALQVGR